MIPRTAFTPREHEVAALLFEGLAPCVVADKLGMSIFTLRKHATAIYRKRHVQNQAELIAHHHPRLALLERAFDGLSAALAGEAVDPDAAAAIRTIRQERDQ